ncbi:MAG: circadian clock protein KaiA [Pseudanabaena sp.]|nr:circadian clock protein KaiA [Pseudanabaena sp. M53BS1SP1A06MG]MCA6583333.1 circadian clock protein KaiA [Pseudanabaena sp. M34BS1SP1A06MG]MCA6584849.1 circadian clock protein KaiA [Pseudanabaena sp. M051S1SP1A06QC]MCA6592603.1 circadian clock protein KaiA [Pseudanabaena sp. M38BS1SP1A06MG]MCA6595842.1 circadian clock protein KaiA [Pseudanabaena sp. M046S1SP1A06QC]MCA6598693.1 circadian clock protein KaiA [Pseudanabaena sp. M57BS1SP1A06MG]MCA6603410.1 circadian clock protein KaiA [Pseudana
MPVLTNLQVCCLVAKTDVTQTKSDLAKFLPEDRYTVTVVSDLESLVSLLKKSKNAQDCLVIFRDVEAVVEHLGMLNIFMPTILVLEDLYEQSEPHEQSESKDFYRASISISSEQLHDLPTIIDQAIATFIKISPQVRHQLYVNIPDTPVSESLSVQQQRLADKLNERLGYLGVYYKRDSRLFFRNLSPEDRQEYIGRLKSIYRSIILEYFSEKSRDLNQKIDEFVNLSFFADISVSQVLEIHMELMDEFAKQLRLEGRNDEILLDYRITLIDMIAHLCELYRRSIPRS